MSEVEQLAQEQFNTFKNRLCEILSEIEEEHKSAFMQGYAKGETDEKFRTKQVVTKDSAELEKEISVLLSCKNCPENKGGYICQKEYEDKCLAQKIQYIKELEQENAELKRNEFNARSCLELQQSQDKAILNFMGEQLTKAKEIIKELNEGLDKLYLSGLSVKQIAFIEQLQDKAEAFINSEVEK